MEENEKLDISLQDGDGESIISHEENEGTISPSEADEDRKELMSSDVEEDRCSDPALQSEEGQDAPYSSGDGENEKEQPFISLIAREDIIDQIVSLRADYPDFSISEESKNESFCTMVRFGISVRNAYEALHLDRALERLLAQRESKLQSSNERRRTRADESALDKSSLGALSGRSVSSMSSSEVLKILERASEGERIIL